MHAKIWFMILCNVHNYVDIDNNCVKNSLSREAVAVGSALESVEMDEESSYYELFQCWKFVETKLIFDGKLLALLNSSSNPYHTLITVCAHRNKPKQANFVRDVVTGSSIVSIPTSDECKGH